MKFISKIILVALPAYFVLPYTPWWAVILISFLVSVLLKSNGYTAFFSSFFAIAGLWCWRAWTIDQETQSILTNKIAALFGIPEPTYLILITAFVGGIAAGFGGLTGHTFKKLFEKKKSLYY